MAEVSRGRQHPGDLILDADVVIVGSGAGGAVVAAELAEAGQSVIVLEEGPHVPLEKYRRMRPSQYMRSVWRDGGMTVALGVGNSPAINVTMGRGIGGSSMLTGGVCFRTPERVHDLWVNERGLTSLSMKALEPCFEATEKASHVEEVPVAMRSRSTVLFGEGSEKMGFGPLKSLKRNTKNCKGCGRCNFGCPEGAKMSVDLTYLPRALAKGAQVWSDCRVDKIVVKDGKAVGVRGRVLNGAGRMWRGDQGGKLEVRARRVVIAAGSFHTPLILMKSGIGKRSGQVGRNMTLHPGFRMFARFDEPVMGWHGALQSAYNDHFEEFNLVGLFIPAGVIAATMHGFGPKLTRRAEGIPYMCVFGGMMHDEAGGRVRRGPGREPVVTYRMAARDRALIPKIIRTMGDTFLAAGAREVFPPILGQNPVDADGFARLDLEHIPTLRIECSSQHPLGSCRMASSPKHGVVDEHGAVWDVDNLYLADGSIVPSSLGVNPQLTIMAMATRIAWHLRDTKPA